MGGSQSKSESTIYDKFDKENEVAPGIKLSDAAIARLQVNQLRKHIQLQQRSIDEQKHATPPPTPPPTPAPVEVDIQAIEINSERSRTKIREELDGQIREELDGKIREELDEKIRGELDGKIREELDGKIRAELDGKLRTELDETIRTELNGTIRAELDEKIRIELDDQIRGELAPKIEEELNDKIRNELETEYAAKIGQIDENVRKENQESVSQLEKALSENIEGLNEDIRERTKIIENQTSELDQLKSTLTNLESASQAAKNDYEKNVNIAKTEAVVKIRQYEDEMSSKRQELIASQQSLTKDVVEKTRAMFNVKQYQTICPDLEKSLAQCYSDNPSTSLLCSEIVKKYSACVEEEKLAYFKRHTSKDIV